MSEKLQSPSLVIGEAYTFEQLKNALSRIKGQYFKVSQQITPGGPIHNAVMLYVHKSGFDMTDEPTIIADGEPLLFYSDGDVLTADYADKFLLTGLLNI